MLRVTGNLTAGPGAPLEAEDVRSLVLPLLEPAQVEELQKKQDRGPRLRARRPGPLPRQHPPSARHAGGEHPAAAFADSVARIAAPAAAPGASWPSARQGLVLVTGPTGCGKSSTLAALIDIVNTRRAAHVVTIEDPVEYQHANRSAIIEQIEVGRDTPDFAVTLRSIMRQTPDVILVGEMRDAETMATALTAAETGHLVFSTLHTNDAIQAVSRILDTFPAGNQPQIRQQLSLALLAVIAQQLVPGRGRRDALAGDGDHDRHRRGARADPQGRRPPAALADLGGTRRGHDRPWSNRWRSWCAPGGSTRETAFAHCFRTDDLQRYLG